MDKEDLEKIEKWKKQKMNYVETYGVDIFNEKEKNKEQKILEKSWNLFYRIAKITLIILCFIIVIGTFIGLYLYYDDLDKKLHVDPIETISGMYNKHVQVISKNVDKDRNGTYILTIEENRDIKFNAIVNWNSMKDDYSEQCQKYYYNKWQHKDKEKLITEEDNEDGILIFNQYVIINDYSQIEESINLMYDFIASAGEIFFPDWNLYLLIDNSHIYPFSSLNVDKESALKYSQEAFNNIKENNTTVEEMH